MFQPWSAFFFFFLGGGGNGKGGQGGRTPVGDFFADELNTFSGNMALMMYLFPIRELLEHGLKVIVIPR